MTTTTDAPKNLTEPYVPERCDHCGQTTTYLLGIDRGTVNIVKAFATAVRLKGINMIHPTKEIEVPQAEWDYRRGMTEGKLTSIQIGNMSRARAHGLLARVKTEPGNWCLTTKGAEFLKGKIIPKFAILSKTEGHQIGYHQPEKYICTIGDFKADMEYWEGINYEIVEGRVVKDIPERQTPLI